MNPKTPAKGKCFTSTIYRACLLVVTTLSNKIINYKSFHPFVKYFKKIGNKNLKIASNEKLF